MADELQTSIIYTLQHLHANHVDQLPLGLLSLLHSASCNTTGLRSLWSSSLTKSRSSDEILLDGIQFSYIYCIGSTHP